MIDDDAGATSSDAREDGFSVIIVCLSQTVFIEFQKSIACLIESEHNGLKYCDNVANEFVETSAFTSKTSEINSCFYSIREAPYKIDRRVEETDRLYDYDKKYDECVLVRMTLMTVGDFEKMNASSLNKYLRMFGCPNIVFIIATIDSQTERREELRGTMRNKMLKLTSEASRASSFTMCDLKVTFASDAWLNRVQFDENADDKSRVSLNIRPCDNRISSSKSFFSLVLLVIKDAMVRANWSRDPTPFEHRAGDFVRIAPVLDEKTGFYQFMNDIRHLLCCMSDK